MEPGEVTHDLNDIHDIPMSIRTRQGLYNKYFHSLKSPLASRIFITIIGHSLETSRLIDF